jgi:hypothetical protein
MQSPINRLRLVPPEATACGIAAICAITGSTQEEAEHSIKAAAAEDGEYPEDLRTALPHHVARAIELLGWGLVDIAGRKVEARHIGRMRIETRAQFEALDTVANFLEQNERADVLLCTAFKEGVTQSHTFAADGKEFKYALLTDPSEMASWRVARALGCRLVARS